MTSSSSSAMGIFSKQVFSSTTSSHETKQLLIMMNDEGARLAVGGSFLEAMEVFSQILSLVRHRLIDEQRNSLIAPSTGIPLPLPGSVSSVREEDSPTRIFRLFSNADYHDSPPAAVKEAIVASSEAMVKECDVSSGHFIFKHLFFSCHLICSLETCSFETLSFTLVYNMALCQHLKMIQATNSGHRVTHAEWKVALELYELAYNVQLSHNVVIPLVFVAAVLNNMVHVYSETNNVASQKCQSTLMSLLMYYVVAVKGSCNIRVDPLGAIMDMCFAGFFRNASDSAILETVAAASA